MMSAMNVHLRALLAGLLCWVIPAACLATAVGTGTIEQPVNLGPNSDPARIPLGAVGTISNHGYGIHDVIGEPRPCPGEAMRWAGGTELDQNLASVFGISVEPEDDTNIPNSPVVIRLRSWKPPGYSPYTREQVLAATLWCLLRSAAGNPKTPLVVRVVAEGRADKPLEKKYSGKYVNSPGPDGEAVPPPKVPGSVIEMDGRGIAWVVFPAVKRKAPAPAAPPAMILFEESGEVDVGEGRWNLLPVWGNGTGKDVPLELSSQPASMCYSRWHTGGRHEANAFSQYRVDVTHEENGDSVAIECSSVPQLTLAAEILALVVAAQPTEKRPLRVAVRIADQDLMRYQAFRTALEWKETSYDEYSFVLKCEFVWDATARKLAKGSVPLVKLDGMSTIQALEHEPPAEDAAREIAEECLRKIKERLHDGSLLAEKNMADNMLLDSGLAREIGKAGYYAALARFCNGTEIPDGLLKDPFHSGDSLLDQSHRAGWDIGMIRGQAIAKEMRKSIEEERRKREQETAK